MIAAMAAECTQHGDSIGDGLTNISGAIFWLGWVGVIWVFFR
jgi:hypothetical protein